MPHQRFVHDSPVSRIVVLGHTGFIGDALVHYLCDHCLLGGDIDLSLPVVDLSKESEIPFLAELLNPSTVVIMCSGIKKQWGDSLDLFSKNVNMIRNLCGILQERPVRGVIYLSSTEVYGADVHNTNISEATTVHLNSYYGIAKYTSECLLRKALGSHEESFLAILRLPLIYGVGDKSKGYGPSGFVWAALNNDEITLWGDGSEFREFIFVEDLVKIVGQLVIKEWDGLLNVVSGKSRSYREVLDTVSCLVARDIQVTSRSRTKKKVDNIFYNEVFSELLPDFSFTSLDEGIKRTAGAVDQIIQANEGR